MKIPRVISCEGEGQSQRAIPYRGLFGKRPKDFANAAVASQRHCVLHLSNARSDACGLFAAPGSCRRKERTKGNSQTDGEDAAIYPQISAGHESRRGFADDVRTPLRDKHAEPSTAKKEERALGQQLANHSASRAAQGGAHGDFSLALHTASEKEAGNIGASD